MIKISQLLKQAKVNRERIDEEGRKAEPFEHILMTQQGK